MPEDATPQNDNIQEAVRALAKTAVDAVEGQDSLVAIAAVLEEESADVALAAFGSLAHFYYWKRKDLGMSIVFGRAGIDHGLAVARRCREDAEQFDGVMSRVKALAYDVASFTWTGWAEPGISISASDLAIGRDAAKTNLRLATEFEKGSIPLSRACWMLGGHHLAAGEHGPAREMFARAGERAADGSSRGEELLSEGFAEIVGIVESGDTGKRSSRLDEILAELPKLEHGEMFAGQIETALRVFASSPSVEPSQQSTTNEKEES